MRQSCQLLGLITIQNSYFTSEVALLTRALLKSEGLPNAGTVCSDYFQTLVTAVTPKVSAGLPCSVESFFTCI